MNQATLTAYEKAARIYCERRGDDPEEQFATGEQLIVGGQKTAPRWHFVAIELHDLSLRLIALKEATQPSKAAKGTH